MNDPLPFSLWLEAVLNFISSVHSNNAGGLVNLINLTNTVISCWFGVRVTLLSSPGPMVRRAFSSPRSSSQSASPITTERSRISTSGWKYSEWRNKLVSSTYRLLRKTIHVAFSRGRSVDFVPDTISFPAKNKHWQYRIGLAIDYESAMTITKFYNSLSELTSVTMNGQTSLLLIHSSSVEIYSKFTSFG